MSRCQESSAWVKRLTLKAPEVGQGFISALESEHLHHAYLLVSRHRHDGQLSALCLAQRFLCANPVERGTLLPCQACPSCLAYQKGHHPDYVHIVPNEKDLIAVDAIRNMTSKVYRRQQLAPRTVIVVDQAEKMNRSAQNALLKTLEEPPPNCHFLMATTQAATLLPTIRSRVITLPLRLSSAEEIANAWQEHELGTQQAEILAALDLAPDDFGTSDSDLEEIASQLSDLRAFLMNRQKDNAALDALELAKTLAGRPLAFELALRFLEVWLHQQSTPRQVASQQSPPQIDTSLSPPQAQKLWKTIQGYRQERVFHPNPQLALENLLGQCIA